MKHLFAAGLLTIILGCGLTETWSTSKTIEHKAKLANIELDGMYVNKVSIAYSFNDDPYWQDKAGQTHQLDFEFDRELRFDKSISFQDNIGELRAPLIRRMWFNKVTYTPEITQKPGGAAFALIQLVKEQSDALMSYATLSQAQKNQDPFDKRNCIRGTYACVNSITFTYEFNNSTRIYSLSYNPKDNAVAQTFDGFETVNPGVFKVTLYNEAL